MGKNKGCAGSELAGCGNGEPKRLLSEPSPNRRIGLSSVRSGHCRLPVPIYMTQNGWELSARTHRSQRRSGSYSPQHDSPRIWVMSSKAACRAIWTAVAQALSFGSPLLFRVLACKNPFMTLLLAMVNDSYSIVLGDRRLVCNGTVCEDESNKVCVLFCDDARVAIAYTGVARHGSFQTKDWLRDTLFEIGTTVHTLDDVLAEFQVRASREFRRFPLASRHTAFLISGYRHGASGTVAICCLLSNFNPDETRSVAASAMEFYPLGTSGSAIVEAAGFKQVLNDG